jgi:hypothetical protein
MNTRLLLWRFILALVLLTLMGGTLSCTKEVQTAPRAWIDFPPDGLTVPVNTPVSVISHAYAREGVAEVLLSVDGEAYRRDPPAEPGAPFSEVTQEWLPDKEGIYTLQVITYDAAGTAGNPATVSVRVVGEVAPGPTDIPAPTPTSIQLPTAAPTSTQLPTAAPTRKPTAMPTATPCLPAQVSFGADDTSLFEGECTTLRWDVEYATAVFLDGVGVVGHGTRKVCPTGTTTYNLHVEAPCGNVDRSVTVKVSPRPDTQGPDISALKSSEDSIDYSCDYCSPPCKTEISVKVTDKSGVAWVKLIYKRAHLAVRGGSKGEQIIKSSIDPI